MILLFFDYIIYQATKMDNEWMTENDQLRQEVDRARTELDKVYKELDRVRNELKSVQIIVVDATLYASEVYQLYTQARDQLTRKRQPFSAPKADFTKL